MLDVCLLGCGGMMPLPYRWLTSLMTRYNGSSLLIDDGECRAKRTIDDDWTKRTGAGREFAARDCTGTTVPHSLC